MHDTADLDSVVTFWCTILGLDVVQRDERYAYLSRLSEGGPHLAFQVVPEAKATKNRLHLDIKVSDRVAFGQWVVALGGAVVGDHQEGAYPTWTMMRDPVGNEFCIYEAQST
jgi:predicted enzyme related to lactoylglutathione lyase